MNIDKDLILKLEGLAKLELSEEERQTMQGDMQNILNMVEKLQELDTENVEPLIYVTEERNEPRPDVVQSEISKEQALGNAPLHDSDYIKVPKVIQRNKG